MLVFASLLLLLLCNCVEGQVQSVNFDQVNPTAPDQIVLFYKPGDDANENMLMAVEDAAAIINIVNPELKFIKVDANENENAAGIAGAGLNDLPVLFISIGDQGMDRYLEEVGADEIFQYINKKLEPLETTAVQGFSSESDIENNGPVFVKFFEQWCSRCSAMKKAYAQVSNEFVNKVRFVEIECSSSQESQNYCQKHGIDGFPTLKFVNNKDSEVYRGATNFFQMHKYIESKIGSLSSPSSSEKTEL